MVAIDLQDAASANWSHQLGATVDDSRDWRNRIFRWFAVVNSNAQQLYPWDQGNALFPRAFSASGGVWQAGGMAFGFGQSFVRDSLPFLRFPVPTVAFPMVAQLSPTNANLPASTNVVLYVDTQTGAIAVGMTGVPGVRCFFWLEASAQFPNF